MLHRRPLALALSALALALACKQEPPPQPPVTTTTAAPEPAAEPEVPCNYLVIVDAGSSGTRAYAYQITTPEGGGVPTAIAQVSGLKASPGLATFKDDPAGASKQIGDLLKQEGGVLAAVPQTCHARTKVAVMATGGMRLLEGQPGGDASAGRLYDAVLASIKETGLDAVFAGTISGTQEAVYGWLSANYALGLVGGDTTVGTLDLGGASSSIAFVPQDAGDAPTTKVKLGDKVFQVYAHSYLNYGVDQARQYLNYDACFPKGVGKGTGKYGDCVKKLESSLKPSKCAAKGCGLADPSDKDHAGVPQPALPAGVRFHAFSVFEYTRAFFKLPADATPAALAEAAGGKNGKAGFCATPYKTIAEQNQGVDEKYLQSYCFDAAFIGTLLKLHGFAPTSDAISWSDKLGEHDATWTLGAALCSVTGCLASQ